jgi:uncharacterized protein YjiS (DUF1127 family)
MSMNTSSHAANRNAARHPRPALFAVIDLMAGAPMAVARWWQVRQDEHLLRSQPDHLLRDVGIERAQIGSVLRGKMQR